MRGDNGAINFSLSLTQDATSARSPPKGSDFLYSKPYNPTPHCPGCDFSALSSQGRWGSANAASIAAGNNWGYGLVWIGGPTWNMPPVWAHEIGHNVSARRRGVQIRRTSELGVRVSWHCKY